MRFLWGTRSPTRHCCWVGPSSEASTQKLVRCFLRALLHPSEVQICPHPAEKDGCVWPLVGAEGGYQDTCWRLGSSQGNLAKAACMCALDNTNHTEWSWRWSKGIEDKTTIETIVWLISLFKFRNEFLVVIAFVQPALLIFLKKWCWFCCWV